MALQIGSTLFVHGGVLPNHAQYGLERINAESRAWMNGSLPQMPSYLGGRQAVVWTRDFSAGGLSFHSLYAIASVFPCSS